MKNQFILFNAADNMMANSINQYEFDKSLLLNILFQDKLILHEAYYFGSENLIRHLNNDKVSVTLFEAASKAGLIIPAYRDEKTSTLEDVYKNMEEIYSGNHSGFNPLLDKHTRNTLFSISEKLSLDNHTFYWPKTNEAGFSLGESYFALLKEQLSKKNFDEGILKDEERKNSIKDHWENTERWRHGFIEQAAENTRKNGNSGIQRHELMKLLQKDIGIPADLDININHILKIKDKAIQKNALVFTKWTTQLHHLNMANYFNASVNLPDYDLSTDFLGDVAYNSHTKTTNVISELKDENDKCLVKLPPIENLLSENPLNLIKIREDYGDAYIYALKKWQNEPNEENLEIVKVALNRYCEKICNWYSTKEPVNVEIQLKKKRQELGKEGLDFILSGASTIIPVAGIVVAAGKLGYAFYKFFKNSQDNTKETSIEINLI
ncbi:hypothetical protein [Flagellimonas olearia]|uniref:Uncharacterized protein n=1 Tax=Flagellimonas olearia TaxID=552546 RepID=A0A444VPV3_9FLAO|nr:hypothetical protein [Allomuricauda olearia]RYC52722.1 hypothetical protein DN53_00450 [Allomuricauda olearia]